MAEKQRQHAQLKWLAKHAPKEVTRRQQGYQKNEEILRHLLSGNDLLDLETNLLFVGSETRRTPPRGFKSNENQLERSGIFNSSIQRIKEYDKDARWEKGLNLMTLWTEYRRKIIFHAMLNSGDVVEERSIAREKLDAYLQLYAPDLLECTAEGTAGAPAGDGVALRDAPLILAPSLFRSQKHSLRDKGLFDQKKKSSANKDGETNFSPKLKDYLVMQNRWKYIQPQIRDLMR